MPTIRLNGGDLYYETHGSGPALIFAHGIGSNHLTWWQQIPVFRERYTCVTFDAPGFGRSEHPDGEWTFVDTLAGLIDHLDLAEVRLVAQSMGGFACLGYTIAQPERVRALVMSDTAGSILLPEDEERSTIGIAKPADLALLARGISPACGERMAVEQPEKTFLYSQIGDLNPIAWRPWQPPGGMERVPSITRADLLGVRTPVLFIIGEEDSVWPPISLERAAAATPGARVERVPRTGHSVYFERPEQFNRIVAAFLSETSA